MTAMSVSDARAALPEILDRVIAGEEVTITRHGKAVAVVVRPDTLRTRRAGEAMATAQRLRGLIEAGRTHRLDRRSTMTAARAEALVEHARASRAGR